jgi:hypothetical protein
MVYSCEPLDLALPTWQVLALQTTHTYCGVSSWWQIVLLVLSAVERQLRLGADQDGGATRVRHCTVIVDFHGR